MVSGGENVIVHVAFAGIAITDLNIAGVVEVDGLNSMNVTAGNNFTLIDAALVPEPGTLLLLGGAMAIFAAAITFRRQKARNLL